MGLAVLVFDGHPGGHHHGGVGILGQGGGGGYIQPQHQNRRAVLGKACDLHGGGEGEGIPGVCRLVQQGAVRYAERSCSAGGILNVQGGLGGHYALGQLQPEAVFIAGIGNGRSLGRLHLAPFVRPLGGEYIGAFFCRGKAGKAYKQRQQEKKNGCFFMCTGHGLRSSFMILENGKGLFQFYYILPTLSICSPAVSLLFTVIPSLPGRILSMGVE